VDLGLKGKGAIVTGGSLGIGAAIARVLAREGCNVAINYRRHDSEARKVVEDVEALGARGIAIQADVSVYADAEKMVRTVVEELGRLDIMVCNAGITWDGVIWKMTEQQWDQVIGVNLKGYFNYNKAAALHFKEMKYGKIVNISSINGMRGKFAQANYAASKGGEIAMSKSLAKELGRFNVNVNVVAPGLVLTDMMETLAPEFQATALAETVLGRFATPEDCANLVAFLCSDLSRHITGEVIKIDGGQYI
jgi:3-oxoacyl-[acyl-carrier protein] reductase